jgi:antitoxin VapB
MQRYFKMATASLFTNGKSQAVRIPKDLEFEGINEVEIVRDGDSIVLTPIRKSWESFSEVSKADSDFMAESFDIIEDGRVAL